MGAANERESTSPYFWKTKRFFSHTLTHSLSHLTLGRKLEQKSNQTTEQTTVEIIETTTETTTETTENKPRVYRELHPRRFRRYTVQVSFVSNNIPNNHNNNGNNDDYIKFHWVSVHTRVVLCSVLLRTCVALWWVFCAIFK